jgi:hypothetical protein
MMCLGWSTKPTCAARPTGVQVGGTGQPAACPDITWFWASAAGILLLGLVGGGVGGGK